MSEQAIPDCDSPSPTAPTLRPGLEMLAGEKVGRDPRTMSRSDLAALGHEPSTPLKAIRAHCLDCCAEQVGEVRRCTAVACDLWPYRLGISPFARREVSAERKEALRKQAASARAKLSLQGA